MTGRGSLRVALWGTCAILTTTLAAQAQQAGVVLLDEVVIESKREVATDIAAAVTEVDQQEIDDRQAGTIAELIDSVPGVTLINGATPTGGGISIRGYGSSGSYGHNQKVLIQVDGAEQGAEELYRLGTQLFTDPELYRRVEVIRGTVGSFEFGSGAVGGVVRMETKDASDFTGGVPGFKLRQALTFGTNGNNVSSSTILAWQPTENFEFLANYVWRETGVQKDGEGVDITAPPSKLPSFLVKGKYSFGDQYVSLSYAETRTSERDVGYDAFSSTGTNFGNVDRDIYSRTTVLSYGWNPAGNELIDFTATLSYADQKFDSTYIPGSSPFGAAAAVLGDADHRYQTSKLTLKNVSRFSFGGFGNELRAGVEFIRKERDSFSSAPGGTDNRVALFLVDEITYGGLTLTPALRYEQQKLKASSVNASNAQGEFENDALMGGLSARYEFANGFAVFGSAAYTESLPIIDDFEYQRTAYQGVTYNFMTRSEKARTIEFGAAYRSGDVFASGDALSVKANAYRTFVWNITSDSTSNNLLNSGKEHELKGLELEAAYSMANGFYGDFNANIVDYQRTPFSGLTGSHAGEPANQFRLTVGKRWGDALDLSWEAVHNARYEGEGFSVSTTTGVVTTTNTVVKSNTVHNLRATYRPEAGILEGTELRLSVENLFDLEYQPRLATRNAVGRNVKFAIAKAF